MCLELMLRRLRMVRVRRNCFSYFLFITRHATTPKITSIASSEKNTMILFSRFITIPSATKIPPAANPVNWIMFSFANSPTRSNKNPIPAKM